MSNSPQGNSIKGDLRKQALSSRAQLPMEDISLQICAHLAQWVGFQQAEQVLFYFPFRGEVDLRALCGTAPDKAWYLPAVGADHHMEFRQVDPAFNIQPGRYGIPEPSDGAKVWMPGRENSLLLVPGLLYDRQGYRLGYGKGYYDRFLSTAELSRAACPQVGIAPSALLVDDLPHDAWDMPMDFLVTERGMQRIQPSDGVAGRLDCE